MQVVSGTMRESMIELQPRYGATLNALSVQNDQFALLTVAIIAERKNPTVILF